MNRRELTTARILDAARMEFATHGFAGARVDRIAQTASCNKQAIYAYVGDKQALWKAVFTAIVVETVDAVPLDPLNLPEYAGQLFDRYLAYPDVLRLSFWHSLEQGEPIIAMTHATERKIAAIQRAQDLGKISRAIPAALVLTLVLRMSITDDLTAKAPASPMLASQLRQAIVEGVKRLVAP